MMARNGEVTLRIYGKSAHGAQPQLGADAVLAAGAVITAIHTILSRNVSPLESGVLTFGSIHGGEACNIIAKEVVLEGTMRAFSDAAYGRMEERVREAVEGVAAGYGCRGEAEFRHMYRVVWNDAGLTDALREVCGAAYEETEPYIFHCISRKYRGCSFSLARGIRKRALRIRCIARSLILMRRYSAKGWRCMRGYWRKFEIYSKKGWLCMPEVSLRGGAEHQATAIAICLYFFRKKVPKNVGEPFRNGSPTPPPDEARGTLFPLSIPS